MVAVFYLQIEELSAKKNGAVQCAASLGKGKFY